MRNLITAALHPHDYKWGLRPWRRHSLVVLVAGCVYISVGITYTLSAPVPSRESALAPVLAIMPLQAWGAVWVAVGTLAIISSRWPPASETWGYSTLAGLSAGWGAAYLFGVLSGAANQSLTGAMVWGMMAFLWWAIAGLWNPDEHMLQLSPESSAGVSLAPPRVDEAP